MASDVAINSSRALRNRLADDVMNPRGHEPPPAGRYQTEWRRVNLKIARWAPRYIYRCRTVVRHLRTGRLIDGDADELHRDGRGHVVLRVGLACDHEARRRAPHNRRA